MFSQRNTPGLGIEYEVYVPAYFALVLNSCEEIEDYIIRSNVEGFGNLDDLVIDLKTKNEEFHFGFQLKHKEKSNNLLPTNFEAKGDFNLEKYCESFKALNDERKKYGFIIYTNKRFKPNTSEELKTFEMLEDDGCTARKFFDTSGGEKIYKFRTIQATKNGKNVTKQDYEHFFSHLTVYPGQKNCLQLEQEIKKIVTYEEQFCRYIEFFRKWHRGDFINKIFDKKTLNLLLLDIFVSPLIVKDWLIADVDNLELLERAIQEFDVVILESKNLNLVERNIEDLLNNGPNYVNNQLQFYAKNYKMDVDVSQPTKIMMKCLIRLAKDFKFMTRTVKKIEQMNIILKMLCYFFQKPLIVDFNSKSKNLIYKSIELCKIRDYKIKLVVMGKDVDVKQFSKLRIFSNLQELQVINNTLFEKIIKKCFISIQGRKGISMEKLMEIVEGIPQVAGPQELIHMLQKDCVVGDNKKILPSYYMNRIVSTYCLDKELIFQQCLTTEDLIIVYYKKTVPEIFFHQNDVDVIVIQTYFKNPQLFIRGTILLTNEKNHYKNFEKVNQKSNGRVVHYIKMVNEDLFLLTLSNKNSFKMHQSKMKKISVEENFIFEYFNNPINIISSGPGTGKSTLLKYLKNECPPEWWVLSLDLKTVNDVLKKKLNSEDFLEYFKKNSDGFLQSFQSFYLTKKKIVIFMDGLDEIETENVKIVVQYTKDFSKMGFRVWLFTRQNLQEMLEDEFHVFMIDIEDLNEEQQKKFVKCRLEEKYQKEEIEEISRQIFGNADIAHNRKILGIPLQLHIVTQIFLDDVKQQISNNFFVLTRMYRIFLEGKYQHFIKKSNPDSCHLLMDGLNEKLDKYKIAALECLFSEEIINKLNIKYLFKQNRRFLENIRNGKDPLGIIAYVDNGNKAVFVHFTFVEYLVCDFLTDPENWDVTRILKIDLFKFKYQNLMTFFNVMLAEESSLHLALIYKDVDLFRKLLESEDNSTVDKGGRNLFHLLASTATRFLDTKYIFSSLFMFPRGETFLFKQLTQILFETVKKEDVQKILQKDEIFEWDPLDYALFSGSFHVIEEILNKFDYQKNLYDPLRINYSDDDIFFYPIKFSYPKILSAFIQNVKLGLDFNSDRFMSFNYLLFDFATRDSSTTQIDIIKLLISHKRHVWHQKIDDRMILTKFLYHAVRDKNTTLTKFFLEEDVDVNYFSRTFDEHVLTAAVKNDYLEIASLLVQKGAVVSCILPDVLFDTNVKMLKLMMEAGADVNARNKEGKNIVNHFASKGLWEEFNLLIKKGVLYDEHILHDAVRGKNVEIIDYLLNQGMDINAEKQVGRNPLCVAVSQGHISTVNFLLEKGADVNVLTDMDKENNILHFCAKNMYLDANILNLLLKKASHLLSMPNKEGATPFHVAFYGGNGTFIKEIFHQELNLEKIDLYNENYPLDFLTKDGIFDKKIIFKVMDIIQSSLYEGRILDPKNLRWRMKSYLKTANL